MEFINLKSNVKSLDPQEISDLKLIIENLDSIINLKLKQRVLEMGDFDEIATLPKDIFLQQFRLCLLKKFNNQLIVNLFIKNFINTDITSHNLFPTDQSRSDECYLHFGVFLKSIFLTFSDKKFLIKYFDKTEIWNSELKNVEFNINSLKKDKRQFKYKQILKSLNKQKRQAQKNVKKTGFDIKYVIDWFLETIDNI